MKLPFKQPKPEDQADKKPVMSDEARRAFCQAALAIDCGHGRSRPQKREEVWISTNGGAFEPARRPLNVGRWW